MSISTIGWTLLVLNGLFLALAASQWHVERTRQNLYVCLPFYVGYILLLFTMSRWR